MAIIQSSRAPQPISVRPMRGVRPGQYDTLDHWLALADLKTAPELFLRTPLPDDQTMCEMYMSIIEPMPWMPGPVHRLSVAAYHPRLSITNDVLLGRFVGSSNDANAPLWVNRLPPRTFLRFSQPLAFVAKLVGGMTDIPVKSMMGDPADDRRMSYWSRDALAIAKALARSKAALARAARASKLIPRCRNPRRGPRWVRGKILRAL
ncbi:hypothetical protein DFH08DRAFT_970194 [Mycena albidolilacea]|uniref:Uncharacterized protein n=1 Tax=Mycena albidolilacea TaxID=1033008 RepID=A0AAD7EFX7_9AGAR|nr:hypothetical protein DFH08DRAFT_970194 [Mycena albidolilacea]